MDKSLATVLFSCLLFLISISVPSSAQTCRSYNFSSNQIFLACCDLPVLSSFIYWNYHPSNFTADIAFRKTGTTSTSWVAWSLNPGGQRMVGSQAIVAFHNSFGVPTAYTTSIDSFSPSMQPGSLSFGVSNIEAEYSNGEMIIFATLQLDNSLITTNQIWQEGSMSGVTFNAHPLTSANTASVGTINFATGTTVPGSGIGSAPSKQIRLTFFLSFVLIMFHFSLQMY